MRDLVEASQGCARPARELRFEMIAGDSEGYPPPARSPLVCLAVYDLPAQR
jgi:hypothetical protein